MQLSIAPVRYSTLIVLILCVVSFPLETQAKEPASPAGPETAVPLASTLGVHFVEGSSSSFILERDGKQYFVDLTTQTVRENDAALVALAEPSPAPPSTQAPNGGAGIFRQECSSCHGPDAKGRSGTPDLTNFRTRSGIPLQRIIDVVTNGKAGTPMQGFAGKLTASQIRDVAAYVQSLPDQSKPSDIYEPADDFVYNLPTGRPPAKGSLYINFTHRFPYSPAFSGSGLGNTLFGFDNFGIASFGLRYGVTDKFSVSVYRSPSVIGRPIEFMGAYNLLDEHEKKPINAAVRVSIDGQDNFRRNFTTNFEGIVSRSISGRAQIYAVPTFSINNRRLLSKPGAVQNRPAELPGIDSFSFGAGLLVNFRPTVALVTEVIPTLYHHDELGIHRPAYAFGIQKQIRGHAFTFGFSNGPGTVVSQRAGTRATFLGSSTADKPRGLFMGFNLMRRLR